MKAFLVACAASVVIAIGAYGVLSGMQQTADSAYQSPTGVRL